jgi:hypothetical protein
MEKTLLEITHMPDVEVCHSAANAGDLDAIAFNG